MVVELPKTVCGLYKIETSPDAPKPHIQFMKRSTLTLVDEENNGVTEITNISERVMTSK